MLKKKQEVERLNELRKQIIMPLIELKESIKKDGVPQNLAFLNLYYPSI